MWNPFKKKHPYRHSYTWDKLEESMLKNMYKQKKSIPHMSDVLQRTNKAIVCHMRIMKLS